MDDAHEKGRNSKVIRVVFFCSVFGVLPRVERSNMWLIVSQSYSDVDISVGREMGNSKFIYEFMEAKKPFDVREYVMYA